MKDIKVYDSNGDKVVALVQWDKDVDLSMSEEYIVSAHSVHFFNRECTEALVVESTYENGTLTVKVPNVLLESSLPIYGYVYIQDDDWRSAYGFRIPVIKRPQPSNYIYEGSEDYVSLVSIKEDILSAMTGLDEAVAVAAKSAEDASASADEAEAAAQIAEAAKNSMIFVSFTVDDSGHVIVNNSELLGTTAFELTSEGHLEVTI